MPASFFPEEFDPVLYEAANPDLAGFSRAQLEDHWEWHGRAEGRLAHRLRDRAEFAALVDPSRSALEIGPFAAPMLRGSNVQYCDVLDRDGLRERAPKHQMDPSGVPEVQWVSPTGDLAVVTRTFDVVLSSHAIEHQPDFIAHLEHVARLLNDGGHYFVLVPDSRFCFDHFIAPSTIAGILGAHLESTPRHRAASVIEHRALTAHNDPVRHWNGDHGDPRAERNERLEKALKELDDAGDGYIDVHAWQFTSETFGDIMSDLHDLGLSPFSLERLYPTMRNTFEFWAILAKD